MARVHHAKNPHLFVWRKLRAPSVNEVALLVFFVELAVLFWERAPLQSLSPLHIPLASHRASIPSTLLILGQV